MMMTSDSIITPKTSQLTEQLFSKPIENAMLSDLRDVCAVLESFVKLWFYGLTCYTKLNYAQRTSMINI